MLSDAPFTSPWSSEVLITSDYTLSVVHDTDEEDELDIYNFSKRIHEHEGNLSNIHTIVTGSECSSDDLYWDADEATFLHDVDICTDFDDLAPNLNDVIDSPVVDNVKLLDFGNVGSCSSSTCSNCDSGNCNGSNGSNWFPSYMAIPEASQAFTCTTVVSSSSTTSPSSDWLPTYSSIPEASQAFTCTTLRPSTKFQECRGKNAFCRNWGSMSKDEKLKLIDELSLTISQDLGLQEKMDIIKIINPSANWSKQQTEFVIDLKTIDDSKLQKIQDIVNCVQTSDNLNDKPDNTANKKFSKKSKNRDRRPRVHRQRIQKENRQKLKERRSGLFVQEEIMAVSTSSMEEDIDVLG